MEEQQTQGTAETTEAQAPTAPTAPAAPKAPKQRANSAYIFTMQDGKLVWTYPGIGVLTLDPAKVSATNRARFIVHGMKQRVNDAAALDAGDDGKVDAKAKHEEMRKMIEHLESGTEEWAMRPSASTTGPASFVTQALVALGTYVGVDVSDTEKANAFVKKLADNPKYKLGGEMGKARKWLEANSKIIREKIAEIRAAEAPAVDADAELEALMTAAE